jgi:hypothetical protein
VTLEELHAAADLLPMQDARLVRTILSAFEGMNAIQDETVQAIDLLNQLDDLRKAEIRELQRTCSMLLDHLGLDSKGSAIAEQLVREQTEDALHEVACRPLVSVDGFGKWSARCSRGWIGLPRDTYSEAQADSQLHRREQQVYPHA